ncbi:MAG: polyketide cyclase / dehydrase and lipid transport [Candidatus Nanopelagicales bacterium]|nr:polyketide cyclase / dehydrase and lipid transport [Candidatus Nanopelagicales bacterium]
MASVDLVDETYVVVDRELLASVIADRARWDLWWPELTLTVFMDRGVDGIRWSVSGVLVGSSEIWLEQVGDGVLLHYYLRADPAAPGSPALARAIPASPHGQRQIDSLRTRHTLAWKRSVWALKDEMEGARRPGDTR